MVCVWAVLWAVFTVSSSVPISAVTWEMMTDTPLTTSMEIHGNEIITYISTSFNTHSCFFSSHLYRNRIKIFGANPMRAEFEASSTHFLHTHTPCAVARASAEGIVFNG